jgi:hypothetical protein
MKKLIIAILIVVLIVGVVFVLHFSGRIQISKETKTTEETATREEEKTGETVSGKLGISNIVFCSENPNGYMDYKEQPDATYKPGETVWIYFNLNGVKYNVNQDETKEIWIKLHLKLKSPEGSILLDEDLYNEHKNFEKQYNMEELFLRVNINTIEELTEGKYTVELELKDELADTLATASTNFLLKK